jgi:hypothetical protein
MTKTRRNSWRGARRAHKVAAHIGWAYRGKRRHGPKSVARYLAAAGISRGALQKYRKARKTPMRTLLKKRAHRPRRYGGVRANPGRRRIGRYASFVRSFSAKHRSMRGPQLMRAAARAWRGGARRNVSITGEVATMNRPRRKRRRGSRARRNPVLPYAAFNKGRKRRKRSRARRNPVLPYAAFNRGRYRSVGSNPQSAVMAGLKETLSVNFWTQTVLPLGAGFMFSQFAGGMVYSLTQKVVGTNTGFVGSLQRIGSRALGAVAVAAAAALLPIGKKKGGMAAKVLAGGLVATLVSIVQEVFGMDTYSKITGMSDFGDMAADLTEELKGRIADSVRNEIARAEAGAPGGVSAFVSTQNLSTAPHLGPGPRIGEMGSFVSQETLNTAPHLAYQSPSGPPVVADLSAFSDSFADMMLI